MTHFYVNKELVVKMVFVLTAVVFFLTPFWGCRFHSIVDFKADEISYKGAPKDLYEDAISKYSVGQTVILPTIQHGVGNSIYALRVSVFSKEEQVIVTLKDVSLSIDDKQIPYGHELLDRILPALEYDKEFEYYYSYVYGSELQIMKPDTKKKIDVTLVVTVETNGDSITNGTIKATFRPIKRTYFE